MSDLGLRIMARDYKNKTAKPISVDETGQIKLENVINVISEGTTDNVLPNSNIVIVEAFNVSHFDQIILSVGRKNAGDKCKVEMEWQFNLPPAQTGLGTGNVKQGETIDLYVPRLDDEGLETTFQTNSTGRVTVEASKIRIRIRNLGSEATSFYYELIGVN